MTVKKRYCPLCDQKKFIKHFSTRGREGAYQSYCKPCFSDYITANSAKARERGEPTYSQKCLRKSRIEALEHYSGGTPKCQCCDEPELLFLTIDHIDGGGKEHRKTVQADRLPRWLKKNGWPPGYRVLCSNCNNARGIYGFCPHQVLRGEDVSGTVKEAHRWMLAK